MKDLFDIYTDRLSGQKEEKIALTVNYDELGFDKELVFSKPITIDAKVYAVSDFLIVHATLTTGLSLPCHICNKEVNQNIDIPDFYFTKPLKEIPHKIVSLIPIFREAILLQVPSVIECGGNCPHRDNLKKYMENNPSKANYHPFAGL